MHEKGFRQAVAIKRIAREQHDVCLCLRCCQKDSAQATGAITVEKPCGIIVVDMHVGCMRDQNLAAFWSIPLHGQNALFLALARMD